MSEYKTPSEYMKCSNCKVRIKRVSKHHCLDQWDFRSVITPLNDEEEIAYNELD